MADNFNILPYHGDLHTLGSTSSHGTIISNYSANSKAYYNLTTPGSTSSHSTLRSSGYQYIIGIPNNIPTLDDETVVCGDSLFTFVTTFLEEGLIGNDYIDNGGPHVFEEGVPAADSLFTQITTYLDETFGSYEEISVPHKFEELAPISDSLFVYVTTSLTEKCAATDSNLLSFIGFLDFGTLCLGVQSINTSNDSLQIGIDAYFENQDSTNIGVIPYYIPPVSDYTDPTNPFEPTIIIGGTTYATNPSTAPAPGYVVTGDTYFVQWLNSGIAGISACDLFNFSFTLDYTGGSFNILSVNPLGANASYQANLGKQVNIFGLQGTITNFGKRISNNQVGYLTEGIFGSPSMHKQLSLLLYGNPNMFSMLLNQSLTQSSPNKWTSYRGAAQAIASAAGINLIWTLRDVPYFEFFTSEGSNAQDALSSLISQVGGTLRWDGTNTYMAAYPNFTTGVFTIPNSALITGSGIDYTYIKDLETGVSGIGLIGLNAYSTFNPYQSTLPGGGSSPDQQIQKVCTITKPFTSSDPAMVVDLPLDAESLKIQILVKTGKAGAAQYVTDSPSTWYDLGQINSIGNKYVKFNNFGGAYIPQLSIDYTLFPALAAVSSGNFVMSFGVTRRDLGAAFTQAQDENAAYQKQVLARAMGIFTYVKTYEATVSCHFFGSIPLPGMLCNATLCGESVSGIIESVQFTTPGILTLKLANYAKVNWFEQYVNINANSG